MDLPDTYLVEMYTYSDNDDVEVGGEMGEETWIVTGKINKYIKFILERDERKSLIKNSKRYFDVGDSPCQFLIRFFLFLK